MKKIYIFLLIVMIVLLLGLFFFFIQYGSIKRSWPNDSFSKQVVKDTKDCFIFLGSSESDGKVRYNFYFSKCTVDSLLYFTKTINENADLIDGKAEIVVFDGKGAIGSVFVLSNYYDTGYEVVYYDSFCCLREFSAFHYNDFWGNPCTYADGIDDVKILEITSEMQGRAEEKKLDWYEIWPNLEKVIIYDD